MMLSRFAVLFSLRAPAQNVTWEATCSFCLSCPRGYHHLHCPFHPLKSGGGRREQQQIKQPTLCWILWLRPRQELVQTKNNGGKQLNAVFKYYFQVLFDWTFSDDMVHWQEGCLLQQSLFPFTAYYNVSHWEGRLFQKPSVPENSRSSSRNSNQV